MKKSILLLATLAIGNWMLISSCAKKSTGYGPNSPPPGTVSTLAGPGFPDGGSSLLNASFKLPYGIAVDYTGNVYVADYGNNMIRKISTSGVVSTLAGTGAAGHTGGPALSATFGSPIGVAIDKSENVYVADYGNGLIRMISPTGIVSTLAGNGVNGSTNGVGTAASFFGPTGIAVDQSWNVYVADQRNQMIRLINSSGVVSTLAGTGNLGSANGAGAVASFTSPFGVAVDTLGNVYVADQGNDMIRVINPSGVVSTLAGTGASGAQNGNGPAASFNFPSGVAVDAGGNIYVADFDNNLIREINPADIVTTLAGNGTGGSANSSDSASFNNPSGVAVDAQQNVFVVDQGNNVIRKIDSKGVVTTLAGNGTKALVNGPALAASFYSPNGIAMDSKGNIYVSELDNVIRMISASGMVSTLAGSGLPGFVNGMGAVATFYHPAGVAVDGQGNVYVADWGNDVIRMISPSGATSTFAGGGVGGGSVDGLGTNATFSYPTGVAIDAIADLYVTDYNTNKIRLVNAVGLVSTLAGNGSAGSSNGVQTSATFNKPVGIAIGEYGYIYVADQGNNLIRLIMQSP